VATLVELAREQRAALVARDIDTMRELSRRYAPVRESIRAQLDAVNARIDRAVARGEAIGPAVVYQQGRAEALLADIERRIDAFSRDVDRASSSAARGAARDAIGDADDLVDAATPPGWRPTFNRVRPDVLDAAVAQARPVAETLRGLGSDAREAVAGVIEDAVGRGIHPRKSARALERATNAPLTRALTITRTETLRAYRTAASLSYEGNSEALDGWMWLSAADSRTCPACFAMHGTTHPIGEPLEAHPNCRCTMVPLPTPWERLGFDGDDQPLPVVPGEQLFARLSDRDKRRILGPGGFDAYRRGDLALSDFVGRRPHPLFGNQVVRRSLRDARTSRGLPPPVGPPASARPRDFTSSRHPLGERGAHAITPELYDVDFKRPGMPLDRRTLLEAEAIERDFRETIVEIQRQLPGARVHSRNRIPVRRTPFNASEHGAVEVRGTGTPRVLVERQHHKVERQAMAENIAHETTHVLDFTSRVDGVPLHTTDKWRPVLDAIVATPEFERWFRIRNKRTRDYVISPWELTARAVSQWLTFRSPRGSHLRRGYAARENHLDQWSDESFRDIDAAIERAFRELGWIG
jgi:SPP1 gp7 family putative phage head morphogenesis protein